VTLDVECLKVGNVFVMGFGLKVMNRKVTEYEQEYQIWEEEVLHDVSFDKGPLIL